MAAADHFSNPTKETIARRVGFHCSYPGCSVVTIGPNMIPAKTSSVGTACHIAGAEPGSKRHEKDMASWQRASDENGIWMCETHGKLIDTDEKRYPTELLKDWKQLAEDVQFLVVEKGIPREQALAIKEGMKLLDHKVEITGIGEEHIQIGNALIESAIRVAWGKRLTDAVRDMLVEYVKNAFQHGGANQAVLQISATHLSIVDDGGDFSIHDLLTVNGTGGKLTLIHLLAEFQTEVVFSSRRDGERNILSILKLKEPTDIHAVTDCTVVMQRKDIYSGSFTYEVADHCREVYVLLNPFFNPSDAMVIDSRENKLANESRQVVFVGKEMSDYVVKLLRTRFPSARVIPL